MRNSRTLKESALLLSLAFFLACNSSTDTGSTMTDHQFSQQGSKLVGTGAVGSYAWQGASVVLSADGNTAIIGGIGDDNAAVAAWVFSRN
jgi:hypothetical protein